MSKFLLLNHSGSFNRGCEAIVKTTSKFIKQNSSLNNVCLSSYGPSEDLGLKDIDYVFDGNPKTLNKLSLNYALAYLQNKTTKSESYYLKSVNKDLLGMIKNTDICLSVGGDVYCYGEQPNIYEINKRIKNLNKKLILWGASIGKEDLSLNKIKDLGMFDKLIVRESITYELLMSKKINSNIKLYPDPAFTLEKEYPELSLNWNKEEVIGINLSPLVYKRNNGSKNLVINIIRYILKNTKYSVALIPHVIKEHDNDYLLLREIYAELIKDYREDKIFLVDKKYNASQMKGIIARTKMFIGARTHSTIAAYSSFVPTMVLGYSVKSRGISKDIFGEEKFVLDFTKFKDDKEFIRLFCEFEEQQVDIRKHLAQTIPEIINKSSSASQELVF